MDTPFRPPCSYFPYSPARSLLNVSLKPAYHLQPVHFIPDSHSSPDIAGILPVRRNLFAQGGPDLPQARSQLPLTVYQGTCHLYTLQSPWPPPTVYLLAGWDGFRGTGGADD